MHAAHECRNFANRQLKRERAKRRDNEVLWDEEADLNPEIYPYGRVAGADAIEHTLSCLSDREREMVHLVEAGYSHAEIAEMMGYASARRITTTMNRIRTKILGHIGGRTELDIFMKGEAYLKVDMPSVDEVHADADASAGPFNHQSLGACSECGGRRRSGRGSSN